ncbi:PIG-L family deacetylase [bacterium]|nr:PIG-L family deacetylase [bacterium]
MNVRIQTLIALVLICFTSGFAQSDWYQNSHNFSRGQLELEVNKIMNTTRVLYVAAHPDDENTRLISWLVNDLHADVAYLSMTRGSGGQNLIGEELGEELGLIREQELLAARRIDGGQQFFTSAVDFGYSKSHEETFEKWGKKEILEQVVYAIRSFKPDIIITRFSPETDGLRSTHGHHTASAILAQEAFEMAGNPRAFSKQLEELEVWTPKAIYWNTSYWSYGSQEKLDSVVNANPADYVKLNVEAYVEELGMTTSEIASKSRSMHKSQGFGTMARYGEQYEYLQLLDGENNHLLLQKKVLEETEEAKAELEKLQQLKRFEDANYLNRLKRFKKEGFIDYDQQQALAKLYYYSQGLRIFISVDEPVVPTGKVHAELHMLHFGPTVKDARFMQYKDMMIAVNKELQPGVEEVLPLDIMVWDAFSQPTFTLEIDEYKWEIPLVYRSSDPVKGEIIQPAIVSAPVVIEVENRDLIAVNSQEATVKGQLKIVGDIGKEVLLQFKDKQGRFADVKTFTNVNQGDVIPFEFNTSSTEITLNVKADGQDIEQSMVTIKHDHLPWIYNVKPVTIRIHFVDAKLEAKKVGYVMGAGDKVPEAIEQLGAEVIILDPLSIDPYELSQFDAIVFGIRALNTIEGIDQALPKFHAYAKAGGNLVFQYNTAHRLKTEQIMPEGYDITLSRDRVTEEDAEIKVDKIHKVLQSPNEITKKSWENWVQERGLYFPDDWSKEFKAPLLMNDRDETAKNGALLIADYGDGTLVYTGISFFRELPAGVEGAYQLWANILSL